MKKLPEENAKNTPVKRRISCPLLRTRFLLIAIALASLDLLSLVQAVSPPPDGGYVNFTTAEGQNALFSLTTGAANTAVGAFSLENVAIGSFNTSVGAGTLLFNNANSNTAIGAAALLLNSGWRFKHRCRRQRAGEQHRQRQHRRWFQRPLWQYDGWHPEHHQ